MIYIDDDVYVGNSSLKREGVARIVCASASAVRSVDRCVSKDVYVRVIRRKKDKIIKT